MGKLDGKVALITGAARGQGKVEAEVFVEDGARVVVTDVLDDLGEKVAAELGDRAVWRHLDVSDSAQWASVVADTVEAFGKLDILVNNAGIFPHAGIEEMSEDEFMTVVRVNLLGCWLGMKSVITPMRDAGGGVIINIASVAALIPIPGMAAYVGTKHAVWGLTKTAAAELGLDGIRVNAVCPGAIVSDDMLAGAERSSADSMFNHLPIPRAGEPADVARAVVFLASEDASYVTGAQLVVDGGSLVVPRGLPARPVAD